jgi:hypothetical protein
MDPDDEGRILDSRRHVEIEPEIESIHRRIHEVANLTELLPLDG